jgi:hypothetical protein
VPRGGGLRNRGSAIEPAQSREVVGEIGQADFTRARAMPMQFDPSSLGSKLDWRQHSPISRGTRALAHLFLIENLTWRTWRGG